MEKSKEQHLNKAIKECENQKDLFKIMNELLQRKATPKLPSHDSASELCGQFRELFSSKIIKIRLSFDQQVLSADTVTTPGAVLKYGVPQG